MKLRFVTISLLIVFMFIAIGCSKDDDKDKTDVLTKFEDIQVNDQFNYATTKTVIIDLKVFNGDDEGVANIPFKVYDKAPKEGGKLFDSGVTNENGIAYFEATIPTYLKELFVEGYMSSLTIPIFQNMVKYEFGLGSDDEGRNDKTVITPAKAPQLEYLSTYNKEGVPKNMLKDRIPAAFLAKVNATLPESRPVPQYHPHYLLPNNE